MVNYRRNRLAGGTYFFTATLQDRQSTYLTTYIDELRQAIRHTLESHPFQIDAIVVLPEHLHTIWTLPAGDADYSGRWRMIKSRFTRLLVKQGANITRNKKGEYDVWQRRYWEHTIRDYAGLQRHVDYTHYNPVKHGFVTRVSDWPYSSFHRYVGEGLLPPDWAGVDVEDDKGFGE
ncbi:MAG: transposase [Pseudomonadota bacterium]